MENSYTLAIKEARKRKGLTQKQAAEKLGIDKKTYVKAENTGGMRLELFVEVCKMFDLWVFLCPKESVCVLGPVDSSIGRPVDMEVRNAGPVVQKSWKDRLNKKA